jgi:hypothetical protein
MKQRPRFLFPLAVAAAAVLGAAATWVATSRRPPPPAPPMLSLERMGHLVSVKVNYANVIEFLQPRTVGIPWTAWNVSLGGTKVLLVAKGDCMVAADLQNVSYEQVREADRTLTVVLPAPAVLQASISHQSRSQGGSYFYAVTQSGLQPVLPGLQNVTAAMNGALRRAQDEVGQACRQPAVMAAARTSAEGVLGRMFATTGWKPRFVWK